MKNEKISLWQRRIADKKSSGLKLEEWCAKNQLTKHAYYYWKRKLAALETSSSAVSLFVELPVEPAVEIGSVSGTMLIQWNELSIRGTDSYSVNLAAELLEKMKFQWSKDDSGIKEISIRQVEWLLQGLSIDQKKAHREVKIGSENACF